MPDQCEFTQEFWKSLKATMTVMLAANGVDARPMTAQLDGEKGPVYFFTAKDTEFGQKLGRAKKASFSLVSKGHDLFAHVHGTLKIDNDREMIDRLWNPYVAAWFEKGKDDPKLTLLRFDADHAEVWKDASSLVAGIKMFLGMGDPKKDYKDKFAEIPLR
jgi:general stress protein 26